jgi:hypothetical protein
MAVREDLDFPNFVEGPSYRMPRRSAGMDPATKRLAIIAGGIGGTLVLLFGAYSLTGARKGGVPVIEAASGPVRVKPDNPGGLEVLGSDETLLGASGDKEGTAPPPETPDPAALRAQKAKDAQPPVAAPPAPPQSAPATPVAIASAPTATATASAADVAPARATASAPPAKPGRTEVQLAALDSEHAALAEWERLAKRYPDLLGGRQPAVSRTEHDGKAFFRLRTGGFSDTADAATFCRHLREKGAACSIATF